MTAGYLLDTNHLGLAVTPGSPFRLKITNLRKRGFKIGTCVPVLCEIEAGIQQIQRPKEYRLNLGALLRQVRIWPIDRQTAIEYGIIHHDVKQRGRVLSQVDIMIAAIARQMRLTLVTTDRDFEALPDIPSENWVVQDYSADG